MVSGIYSITNKINGKRYVGSAINIKIRWTNHRTELKNNKSHCPHLQNAWNKYGAEIFNFEILEYVVDVGELLKIEQYYLDWLETYNREFGYNTCKIAGNTLGRKCSEETKKKIGDANRGKIQSVEARQKNSDSNKGKIISQNTRKRMSISNSGEKNSGAKMTLEKVNKMRELYNFGFSVKEISLRFDMSYSQTRSIVKNLCWNINHTETK